MEQREGALEGVVMFGNSFAGKRVWISGTTGFKGSWLAEWLLRLGADVHAVALPPNTNPSLFEQLNLESRIHQTYGDIRDLAFVRRSLEEAQPDYVFHLAAQALVRESYVTPVETFATNVMGTAHVLEALRFLRKPCAAVMVTTDKCYENREQNRAYKEDDPLGGHDPYSASKAAAEITIASYRRSFFKGHPVRVASVRAGNVIGGGDWALDRIIPDCVRALSDGKVIPVRNPVATRPWQHVLEPLSGYLWLASMLGGADDRQRCSLETAFNFGPRSEANRTVLDLVQEVLKSWPGRWEDQSDPRAVHEARLLHLAIEKAHDMLAWSPVWDFPTSVRQTVMWYREVRDGKGQENVREFTGRQIDTYEADARVLKLAWTAQ